MVRVESRQPGNPPPIIELKAPIGGLVVQSHVRLGEPVEPDKELLDISDLSEVYAIARVPEHQAAQLKPGTKAHIVVSALGKQIIEGEMLRFGTSADRESGTIDAIFRVANPDLQDAPGHACGILRRAQQTQQRDERAPRRASGRRQQPLCLRQTLRRAERLHQDTGAGRANE